jgi:hypothetical protein
VLHCPAPHTDLLLSDVSSGLSDGVVESVGSREGKGESVLHSAVDSVDDAQYSTFTEPEVAGASPAGAGVDMHGEEHAEGVGTPSPVEIVPSEAPVSGDGGSAAAVESAGAGVEHAVDPSIPERERAEAGMAQLTRL